MRHSYPWYIADWRNSETRLGLSLAGKGLYRELLDYCYLMGSFPADESKIKSISNSDGHDFARAWKQVRPLFTLISNQDGERFVHPKVNEVRSRLDSYDEQRKEAGRKSGRTRAERAMNERSTDQLDGSRTQDESTTSTSTSTIKPPNPPAPDGACVGGRVIKRAGGKLNREAIQKALGDRLPWWLEFRAEFPQKSGELDGMNAFEQKVKTRELYQIVLAGAKRYAAWAAAHPDRTIKYPQGWINSERWTDQESRPAYSGPNPLMIL